MTDMRNDHYPVGTVSALLHTDLVKPNTMEVLLDRLDKKHSVVPRFFDEKSFQVLHALCTCLIPQANRLQAIDLPGLLEEHLISGAGKGWRYNEMPPDKITFSRGLYGINETSESIYQREFTLLDHSEQDIVIKEIQSGVAEGKTWDQISPVRFFDELLALLTELYYSHPIAKEEIGEVSFADGKGWQRIGLNQLEAHEPLPIKYTGNGT